LQQEKLHRQKALEEAAFRVEHGQAPSEEVVKEFGRAEKKKVFLLEAAQRREEELSTAQMSSGMLKTAAEVSECVGVSCVPADECLTCLACDGVQPRPSAYIPDELGIPKPYGNLAPFKPTELGSTMRHIRPPVIKPIEI
jgi:hypothetical protein